MIKQILLVGAGGAMGSILRFLTSEITARFYSQTFPLATFVVNIVGCLIIGFLINAIPTNNSLRLILMVGFCGGFTTFSAFARETTDLITHGQTLTAAIYVVSSCLLGTLAIWAGMLMSK